MESALRVFVVEDQSRILKNQLKLFEASPELQIIGTAASGEAALEQLAEVEVDVLLLDLGLPGISGIEVTREVKARWPQIEILIFTIFDEEDKVLEAISAGASGYLLKGTPTEKIIEAMKEVKSGGTIIQPSLARKLLRHFRESETAPAAAGATLPVVSVPKPLSDREREILQLIGKGISNSEAARLLNISRATIRTHLEHIYRKLEVSNRVEAVTEGIRKGIISV